MVSRCIEPTISCLPDSRHVALFWICCLLRYVSLFYWVALLCFGWLHLNIFKILSLLFVVVVVLLTRIDHVSWLENSSALRSCRKSLCLSDQSWFNVRLLLWNSCVLLFREGLHPSGLRWWTTSVSEQLVGCPWEIFVEYHCFTNMFLGSDWYYDLQSLLFVLVVLSSTPLIHRGMSFCCFLLRFRGFTVFGCWALNVCCSWLFSVKV